MKGASVILCIILTAVALRQLFSVWKTLIRCMVSTRANYNLEFDLRQTGLRNSAFYCLLAPVCLLLSDLFAEPWMSAASILAYLAVRESVGAALPFRRMDKEWKMAAIHGIRTILLVFSPVLLVTVLACNLFSLDAAVPVTVIFCLIFLLDTFRAARILRDHYSLFTSFLYLCALIFLPVSVFIMLQVWL